jgi:hypothetical protein
MGKGGGGKRKRMSKKRGNGANTSPRASQPAAAVNSTSENPKKWALPSTQINEQQARMDVFIGGWGTRRRRHHPGQSTMMA